VARGVAKVEGNRGEKMKTITVETTIAAKDKSASFDFTGLYTAVKKYQLKVCREQQIYLNFSIFSLANSFD
jgi:hypothetical protein